MAENIIISDQGKLKKVKESISKDGPKKLHVLTDFDRTLTKAFVNGESVPSLISILRDGNYLSSDYAKKANALYDKYHPIEIDSEISLEDKKKAMREWWITHFDLLIKSGLNKKDLGKVAESSNIQFRRGATDFIDFLHERDIPLVIISSSGLGGDVIAMYFAKHDKLYGNIYIVSNSYEWDENGKAIGVKEPIIHTMNKEEAEIKNLPFFDAIKSRQNVILLGDSLGDVGMAKGLNCDNLIKVGFLNENAEENLEQYKKNYDIVILNDAPMNGVNALLKELVK